MILQLAIPVYESSQVGEARRRTVRMAEEAGGTATEVGNAAIIATELATNLVRHAHQGELLLQSIDLPTGRFIELVSIDRGPGIADIRVCLTDGYSTTGTAGTGLGAIKRLSEEFEIYSSPSAGTVMFSRVRVSRQATHGPSKIQLGGICLPMSGESACGDIWGFQVTDEGCRLMVADGLGHGPLAAEAAAGAAAAFEAESAHTIPLFFETAHRRLSPTRGAAVAIAEIQAAQRRLTYAGVGNISGTVVASGGRQGLVSQNGIAGVLGSRIRTYEYPWTLDSLLIMHSDGLRSRWSLTEYPGLTAQHPALIAAVLYRDYRRDRDDTTVVVLRCDVDGVC